MMYKYGAILKTCFFMFMLVVLYSITFARKENNEEIIKKADNAFKMRNYDEAAEGYTKAIENDSSNAKLFYYRGIALLYNNQFEMALDDFNKSISIDSSNADAFNNRGLAYTYLGNDALAMDDFGKAITLDSGFAQAYLNRATAYIGTRQFNAADKDINMAIKLDSSNPTCYYERARLKYKQKNYTEAADDFTKAMNFGIKNSKVFYNRGNAYFADKNYEMAIKDYTTTLRMDSTNTDALNNRAIAYEKLSMKDKAEEDRRKLRDKMGFTFPPLEKVKFKKFVNRTKDFQIELPQEWLKVDSVYPSSKDMIISREPVRFMDDLYAVGVKMSLNTNMFTQYKVRDPVELLDFWKGSTLKNSEGYFKHTIYSEQTFHVGKYTGSIFKVLIQVSENSYPVRLTQVVVAKEDNLFYAYFQAPEQQYNYYEKLFDNAIKTLWVN